jgi:NAD(P)-dependent dehydrogenase (short-subunit alcohol dehydrogenase family)
MRRNIQAIRAAGSPVEYHSLDVRDEAAFAGFIAQIRQQFKRLDGIIHGAGVIEDKLIRDKTPDSFDRVFGTKVRSAWNISQISPDDLKFCVFFASIASRYGNKGQADYAAANEVLCKLAADLDRRWPARVFAVAWGPWAETGMVSDLEKHLTARGVTLISPREGTDHLLRELQFGAKGETEVLIAGGAERLASPSRGKEPLTS